MKIGGKNISNWWLIGGGLGVVAAVYFYRKASAASSADSSADSSSIDPVTGLPYSMDNEVDPATGLTYLAEAQEYGSVSAAEQEVSSGLGYDTTGDDSGIEDAGYPTGWDTSTGDTTPTGTTYATNAQWAAAVQAGLVGLGYSSETVGAALGLFFSSQPLNPTYVTIMQTALAEYGPPPQGTYTIIGGGGGGGGTTGQTVGGYQAYAPGGKRLDQLTVPGVTYADLAKANPKVAQQYSGKPLPKGTGYYVPKETAPATTS